MKTPEPRDASLAPAPAVDALQDIRRLIDGSRQTVATAVDAVLTMLYRSIGKRIREEFLKDQRAEYGQEIVSTLGEELSREYGSGFSGKNLRHMMRFAETYPDEEIVSALRRQLSWTHFKSLIYLEDPLQREF